MSKTIHAQIRYIAIDKCLSRTAKRWTWQEIAEECGEALRLRNVDAANPSRRALFYDFANMRSGDLGYHAPISCVDRKYYIYDDPRFSIRNIPIDNQDLVHLYELFHLMKSHHRMPMTDEFYTIISQLDKGLNKKTSPTPNRLLIDFDQLSDVPGQQWFHVLFEAVRDQRPMKLIYHSFTSDPVKTDISPYLLKEYNRRWFIIAYNHSEKEVYTYALDRILDIDIDLLGCFYKAPSFHPIHRYEHLVGVTKYKNKKPVEVLIKTTKRRADYLRTKPLHKSQKEVFSDHKIVHFTYFLIPNYELNYQLFAMVDEIEVLEPLALRNEIAQRLKTASKQYSL